MPKGRIVPVTQEQVVAGKLRNLHERLRLTRQAMRSPTVPLYDPDFPDDAVDGQIALQAGQPYYYWDGAWHPFGGGAYTEIDASHNSSFDQSLVPFASFDTSDQSVFATSTAAAPTVESNSVGDQHLMLKRNGMYLARLSSTVAGGGAYFATYFDEPTGTIDIHGFAVENQATTTLAVDGSSALWMTDTTLVVNFNTTGLLGIVIPSATPATSAVVHLAVFFWPSPQAASIY